VRVPLWPLFLRGSIMASAEREGFNKGVVRVAFMHFVGADPCADFDSDPPAK
jgi:hypothetical protein